ncbi:uncharacterized protein LOC110707115 [Chenopodium quinoa]|uniref:uncharacterized protein LOC110707115 n=1 Tax=Chenopodium quinoa TaxID=63459 RepID=UPI000B78CB67|nr:uncharacterized protein LOC110707115 [Chenopodium quinoa]
MKLVLMMVVMKNLVMMMLILQMVYEVDEDVEDDGEGSKEEFEQDKVSYQDLLIKLLREKIEKGKRKRGHIEKRTGKRGKLKVEKTKGEVAKEKGVVVKTQSRSTQKLLSEHYLKSMTWKCLLGFLWLGLCR